MNGNGWSKLAIIGAIVALLALGTAAVLFTSGDSTFERLGLLFGLLGTTVLGFMSLLRSDQAATSTDKSSKIAGALDGAFEARVRSAVRTVQNENPQTGAVIAEQQAAHTASEAAPVTTSENGALK